MEFGGRARGGGDEDGFGVGVVVGVVEGAEGGGGGLAPLAATVDEDAAVGGVEDAGLEGVGVEVEGGDGPEGGRGDGGGGFAGGRGGRERPVVCELWHDGSLARGEREWGGGGGKVLKRREIKI